MATHLRWKRTKDGDYKSECGRYTICRTKPRQWRAHCWRETATGSFSWGLTFPTLREAKQHCARDARRAAEIAAAEVRL